MTLVFDDIESSNTSVIRVEPQGKERFIVWAVAPGTATLHMSGGSASDDVEVKVIVFPE
jgi:hypothetical protein